MSRFLFVVPPLVGHINPTVGVASALTALGHEVAWAGHDQLVASLVGPESRVLSCGLPVDENGETPQRPADLRGPAALKFLWESFLIPLAEAMIPGVYTAVDEFKPDVVVVDQQAMAGAIVARRRGLPWATSATTAAELADPLSGLPKVAAWVRENLLELEARTGDPNPDPTSDLRFSPALILAYSTQELSGRHEEFGRRLRYVGPSIAHRPPDAGFPWGEIPEDRPVVLVSLGTANVDAGGDFLRASAAALAEHPGLFGVIVDPTGAISDVPENVAVFPRVPQLELLRRCTAVVCHAGQNTVCEALYHGLPLLVAPIRDDQPVVAQQAVDAGVALRLRFGRAGAPQIGAALDRILAGPAFRAAAEQVAASFKAAGGTRAAAESLMELL